MQVLYLRDQSFLPQQRILSLGIFFLPQEWRLSRKDVVSNMVKIERKKDLEGRKVLSPLMENVI